MTAEKTSTHDRTTSLRRTYFYRLKSACEFLVSEKKKKFSGKNTRLVVSPMFKFQNRLKTAH